MHVWSFLIFQESQIMQETIRKDVLFYNLRNSW